MYWDFNSLNNQHDLSLTWITNSFLWGVIHVYNFSELIEIHENGDPHENGFDPVSLCLNETAVDTIIFETDFLRLNEDGVFEGSYDHIATFEVEGEPPFERRTAFQFNLSSSTVNSNLNFAFCDTTAVIIGLDDKSTNESLIVNFNSINNSIQLYNPNKIAIKHIGLYNLQGKLIWQSNNIESNISLHNYSKGIYILKVEDEIGRLYIEKVLR